MNKKIFQSLAVLGLFFALTGVSVRPARAEYACVNVFVGTLKVANHCANWTLNRILSPYLIKCANNGYQTVTWYQTGYTFQKTALTCTPQYWTSTKATGNSKIDIYKNGVKKTSSSIKCVYPANPNQPEVCSYIVP